MRGREERRGEGEGREGGRKGGIKGKREGVIKQGKGGKGERWDQEMEGLREKLREEGRDQKTDYILIISTHTLQIWRSSSRA